MALLFNPININQSIALKNRIVISPMCQYSAIDGFANHWHLVHLGSRAVGGAAAIIQEATAVTENGRISYGDLGIWKDEHIDKLKEITHFIKENGAVPGIQLAHAGRKASTEKPWIGRTQIAIDQENGWQTVAPSEIPFNSTDFLPKELSIDEIQAYTKAFVDATKRAITAGYEIIELHGAHGYLIHQFLSPLINQRSDEYGGSFENRTKFLIDIVKEVKKILTTQSLWVRLSATDWAENGWDLEQTIELSKILKNLGVDVIDVSSGGGVAEQKISEGKNYQVPFAEAVKKESETIVGAVGLIFDAQQAEKILRDNQADLILIGRESLRDPYFPLHAAKELGVDLDWPNQYARAKNNHYL